MGTGTLINHLTSAFKAQPDNHRRITVKTGMDRCRRRPIFGFRVIQGKKHIQIEQHVAGRKRREPRLSLREGGEAIQRPADQFQTGCGGVEFLLGLLELEPGKSHTKNSLGEFGSGSMIWIKAQ